MPSSWTIPEYAAPASKPGRLSGGIIPHTPGSPGRPFLAYRRRIIKIKVCRRAREPFWDIPAPKMTTPGDHNAATPFLVSPCCHTCALAHISTKQGNLDYPALASVSLSLAGDAAKYNETAHPAPCVYHAWPATRPATREPTRFRAVTGRGFRVGMKVPGSMAYN